MIAWWALQAKIRKRATHGPGLRTSWVHPLMEAAMLLASVDLDTLSSFSWVATSWRTAL